MRNKRRFVAFAMIPVWAYAAAVWASIGHHLLGLPDLVPLAAGVAGLVAAAWALGVRQRFSATLQTRQPQGEPTGD